MENYNENSGFGVIPLNGNQCVLCSAGFQMYTMEWESTFWCPLCSKYQGVNDRRVTEHILLCESCGNIFRRGCVHLDAEDTQSFYALLVVNFNTEDGTWEGRPVFKDIIRCKEVIKNMDIEWECMCKGAGCICKREGTTHCQYQPSFWEGA